ncbi:MAG: hypothetical protein DA408_02290 [Bacteroidetes bacterium]|nr:MAG: hypothetical protein C7N36_10545 [Bacteroidota bacterium]PTM14640.1 MAG: hypothetical protein DA408_02290 [Bacteroidota bacterium]
MVVALMVVSQVKAATSPSVREFSKTINKQFNITSDGLVNLSNKYGKIDIKTWEQKSVRISVKIVVNAKDESAAQTTFDRININFYNSASSVGAETEIADKKSSWWDWGNNSDEFSINYEVYMPASCNLEVMAKYCDVFAAAIVGKGEFSIKYGNVKLDGLGEDSSIELAYGNGTIRKVRDLGVNLAYGNLDVGEASDVNIDVRYGNFGVERAGDIISESRYSNFKLGEIREFRNNGKYDNVEIGFAEEVVCETHYTNVQVGRLSRRLSLDMAYGSAKTMQVDAGFSEINLNGRYTDFKLYMGNGVACTLDLTGNYADIRLPSSGVTTSYDAQNGNSHQVRGTMGSGGKSTIIAHMSYGGITVAKN